MQEGATPIAVILNLFLLRYTFLTISKFGDTLQEFVDKKKM